MTKIKKTTGAFLAIHAPLLSNSPKIDPSLPRGEVENVGIRLVSDCLRRSICIFAAGKNIPKTKKVKTIPILATMPKSFIGGQELVRFERNPITVVAVTMKNAMRI